MQANETGSSLSDGSSRFSSTRVLVCQPKDTLQTGLQEPLRSLIRNVLSLLPVGDDHRWDLSEYFSIYVRFCFIYWNQRKRFCSNVLV